MTKQVHSNSLADCLDSQDSKKIMMVTKLTVSTEVIDLISKIKNRSNVTENKTELVLEIKVSGGLSS